VKRRFILPWSLAPSRAFRCPPTCRRVRRLTTPSGFLVPSTVSLGRAPCGAGCHAHPGSARRFSQPLSGFLANPSFAALFHAATVPGIPPSELSPRRGRLPLSGQLGFPAVIHRRAETRRPTPCRPWFHRRPRRSASAWIPQRLWAPFPPAEARFPVPLGAEPRDRLVPPASPTSKRPSLFESVRDRSESPRSDRPMLSWVSAPLESSPSKPRSLIPAKARGPKHARLPVGSGTLPTGSQPSRPGEASPVPRKFGSTCSTASDPLRGRPAPPLGGAPPLLTLERRAHPTSWPTESLSHLPSGVSSAEAPTLVGFPASSPTS
jgi:hypothetical protein